MSARRVALAACCSVALAACSGPSGHPARSSAAQVTSVAATAPGASSSPAPAVTSARNTAVTTTVSPAVSPAGPLVVLNPGHDGGNGAHAAEIARLVPSGFGGTKACDTTGTSTVAGYPEHAFAFDVALRVRAILVAHGVRVVLTRQNDTGVGPCVDARAAVGNAPGVAATVSIHADGTPDGSGHGFHVCEASRPPAGPAVAARSHALTVAVHDALTRSSGLTPSTYVGSDGYYPRDDLAALNLATGPATFLELGNMRNSGDAALLSSPAGRQRIAEAVAAGILAFVGR